MTVRVERDIRVPVSPEVVWEFIADPAQRAGAISVVTDYDIEDEAGQVATWHVELPIPFVSRTVPVRTEETTRTPPEYVRFVGESRVLEVIGEHSIDAGPEMTTLTNTFTVDGSVPGVEQYFKRNLDDEIENLADALQETLT